MNNNIYSRSLNLIYKAVYLYYNLHLSESEIARSIHVSTATVSRLLKEASELNLITVQVTDNVASAIKIENDVRSLFLLKDVIVAPVTDKYTEKEAVALECARFLQSNISPETILGIAFECPIKDMLDYINPCKKTSAQYVFMHGTLPAADYQEKLEQITYLLRNYMGGKTYVPTGNIFPTNKEVYDYFMAQPNNIEIFNMYKKLTMSVCSISTISESFLITNDLIQNKEIVQYITSHDSDLYECCMRFFNMDGGDCGSVPYSQWIFAISTEEYKKIPTKIVIANGTNTLKALEAAIKENLIDILIVDQNLAQALLNDYHNFIGMGQQNKCPADIQ